MRSSVFSAWPKVMSSSWNHHGFVFVGDFIRQKNHGKLPWDPTIPENWPLAFFSSASKLGQKLSPENMSPEKEWLEVGRCYHFLLKWYCTVFGDAFVHFQGVYPKKIVSVRCAIYILILRLLLPTRTSRWVKWDGKVQRGIVDHCGSSDNHWS